MPSIEVAYATPEQQVIIALNVPDNTTIETAIALSGLKVEAAAVGIFGKLCNLNDTVKTGDRIELYRPLVHDPKEARRQRAAK
jgi:putative ubiquitin-RnfH superfamily antitoxin RatB of RatAB toxin-antitoxin module